MSGVTHGYGKRPKPNRLSLCSWSIKGSDQLENPQCCFSYTCQLYKSNFLLLRHHQECSLPFLRISGVKAHTRRYVLPMSQHGRNAESVTCGAVLTAQRRRNTLLLSRQQATSAAQTSGCLAATQALKCAGQQSSTSELQGCCEGTSS